MPTANPFDLLGGDDAEDPSLLVAARRFDSEPKKVPGRATAAQGKLLPKPPSQAVNGAKSDSSRRGGGRGYDRELSAARGSSEAGGRKPFERYGGGYGETSRGGGGGGGYSNGEFRGGDRELPCRQYEHQNGTGKGVAEGDVVKIEKGLTVEKPFVEEYIQTEEEKEAAKKRAEERECEAKLMTLGQYEKILEEKRKSMQALKTGGRKVDAMEFEAMQALSNKKSNEDIFIKLGSEKDKSKELAEKERTRKSMSIHEFLKPAEGERRYYGRGRGGLGRVNVSAPSIEDPDQFPTLRRK